MLYYMFCLALTGMDRAILATQFVYLIGDLNVVQWVAQLGLLTLFPLALLYSLEYGAAAAAWRILAGLVSLSPIFFLFGTQVRDARRVQRWARKPPPYIHCSQLMPASK